MPGILGPGFHKPDLQQLGWDPRKSLGRAVIKASGLPQMGSDAYWAFTHPLDRLTGKGRASNPTMAYPGPLGSVSSAIMLGPGSSFRSQLAKKLQSTIAARMALERADSSMLLLNKDNPAEAFLSLFRPFEGKAQPGKRYLLKDVQNKHGASVSDRIAMIQDPKTGTIFAAPNVLHGDLIDHVADLLPGMPRSYPKWFQHELYDATPEYNAPARLLFGLDPRKDTELATYARAKLVGKLKQAGIGIDKASKRRSYRDRLAAPNANKAMADMLNEVLRRGSKHPSPHK